MVLNKPKTVVIPLWIEDLDQVQVTLDYTMRGWGGVAVRDKGAYLGFIEGPAKSLGSWEKPLAKY